MSDLVIDISRFRWWQRIYLALAALFATRLRFGRKS